MKLTIKEAIVRVFKDFSYWGDKFKYFTSSEIYWMLDHYYVLEGELTLSNVSKALEELRELGVVRLRDHKWEKGDERFIRLAKEEGKL